MKCEGDFNYGAVLGLIFGIGAVVMAVMKNEWWTLFFFAAIFFVIVSHLGYHKKKR